jgi:ubiquinone biosynthesis protein UbiJ
MPIELMSEEHLARIAETITASSEAATCFTFAAQIISENLEMRQEVATLQARIEELETKYEPKPGVRRGWLSRNNQSG